jgi:hypothetical protein
MDSNRVQCDLHVNDFVLGAEVLALSRIQRGLFTMNSGWPYIS